MSPYTKKFSKLLKSTDKEYTGKLIPKKYQSKYPGEKRYTKKEADSIAFGIAQKHRWEI
jgi:hypothetical protein